MKAFLITAVVCFIAITFFAASRLVPMDTDQATEQAMVEALGAQVSELRTDTALEIADLKEVILAHQAEVERRAESSGDLVLERNTLTETLTQTRAELVAATDAAAVRSADLSQSLTQIAELDAQRAELDARLTDANAMIEILNDTIAASASDAEVAELQTQLAERNANVETLREEVAVLTANLDAATQVGAGLDGEAETDTSQIDALTAEIAQRDTQIAALETQLTDIGTTDEDGTAEIEALTAAVQERDATIAALTAEQSETSAADPSELEEQVAGLEAQIAQLDDTLEAQSGTIETLRLGLGDAPSSTAELAEICVERAEAVLTAAQITFATGTTTINDSSAETLERLRDLAIGCKNDDLIIEIGGHTDSQGAETSNQIISELRAQAVLDFMIANGVSPDDLRAVGFGEAEPIADNATGAGRAANRRITFDWQPREVVAEATEETAPEEAPESAEEEG